MSKRPESNNFTEFLEKCFGRKVVDYSMKPLTKPGDNYGSVLHAVEVKISGECQTETLQLVCKSPIVDPQYVEVFQPSITFVKENRFYSDIVPTLKQFEDISNFPHADRIDVFFECFGSRISLDPNAQIADFDALLILENAKFNNFVNGDRLVGFNTEETVAVLRSLAQLHALCIAIRLLQPKIFDSRIKAFSAAVNIQKDNNDHRTHESVHNELHLLDKLDSKLRQSIQKQLIIGDIFCRDTNPTSDTPYTTIVHRDLWMNNIMIKKERDMPVKIEIYDFQMYFYQSFVHDLIFFLFTSVRPEDLKNNFNDFINHYYSVFVKTLKLANCPLDNYSFEKMWAEIQDKAKIELLHTLFMIKVTTFDPKSQLAPGQKICRETFYNWKPLPEQVSTRWQLLIDIFVENGFI